MSLAAVAVLALALLLRLAYGAGNIGFDAVFSLVWGDELRHLHSPDYAAAVTPTPHPLANLVGALASLTGRAGFDVLIGLSFVCFAALGVVAYVAGRRAFGTTAGVAFAAILLTRPLLVAETLQASLDIPFLALVLAALALELGRERRGAPVLVALALAGLLRPEAWVLSFAYLAYLVFGGEDRPGRRRLLALAALALIAPVLWVLTDLVTTGHALFSFTRTHDLAARLERERGTGAAVRDLPIDLETAIGQAVIWLGIGAGAVTLFAAQQRARLPLGLLVLGMGTFLALGAAGLPLLNRYLLVPSAALALFCAAGLGAFAWLRVPGRGAAAGIALSALVGATLAATAPGAVDDVRAVVDHSNERASLYAGLLRLADAPRTRELARTCRPLQAAIYRPIPVLAYRLGVRPSQIGVRRPFRARRGLVFAARIDSVVGDVGLYPGVIIPSEQLVLPRTFTTIAANGWGTVAARGC